jgi:TolB protein
MPCRPTPPRTLRVLLLALATVAVAAAQPVSSPATIRVRVEPLTGSTGASIAALIEADLQASGAIALTADPVGAVVVGGSVAGSRLEGRLTDADGTELLRNMYDGPDLRRGAHELADDVVFALTGRPGIATSRLAFVSDVTGRPEIYVCEADGRERRRVTYDGTMAAHPSIDRTGSLLTYTSLRGVRADIIALDLMNGARRPLVTAPGGNHGACLSPDGSQIALTMVESGWPTVVTMTLDGSSRRRLSRPGWVTSAPAWSPDGHRVVFTSDAGDNTGLQLHEGRPGGRTRQLHLGVTTAASADWSPDGQRLVFVTRHRDEAWLAVWERGAARVRLLGPGQDPCWGADSRHILFSTGDRLVTLHTETGNRRTIVENFGRLGEPTWTK